MQIDELSSSNDPLLQPFKLKHLTLKNRIMSTSHACGLDENGLTGNKYQAYHEEKARGGLALTMFGGSASVAPDSLWPSGQVNVSTDAIIPLFEQFTAKVHHHGCALMCQISHLGRRAECYAGDWLPAIGPSPIQVTDLTHERTTMMMDFGGELLEQWNNRIGAHVNLTRGPERIWCYRC
jgi:2,4-dienoyl-CoA reductase-like NADH-dependent reductase (Old Yellow Enzyme family)